MADVLRGNYKVSKPIKSARARKPKKGLTEEMEREALAKLGGSITFVMKGGTFMWDGEPREEAGS